MFRKSLPLLLGITLTLVLIGCDSSSDDPSTIPITPTSTTEIIDDITIVDNSGNTDIDLQTLSSKLEISSTSSLTQEETDGLLYMREEEKLARDVYLTLYGQWQLPIFQNISNSEQTHTDAVAVLLDRYDLSDPITNKEKGEFENTTLQDLYDQLVDQGSQSLSDALKVGTAIEEIDIIDLQHHIAQTDKTDIILVYENLMKGSRNHLRSFISTLKKQVNETYQPQYLSQAEYDSIINVPIERGGQR